MVPVTILNRAPTDRRLNSTLADRQRQSRAKFEKYRDAPIDEDVFVSMNTKKHRQWLMGIWNHYFHEIGLDPDSIWLGLCDGDKDAAIWCKTFFSDYVDNSMRRTLVLGPEEYVDKRMLNCASSVLSMWRKLVKEADLTVLKARREQQPRDSEKWRLRFYSYRARPPRSSVLTFEISLWIWNSLANEANLCKELTFDKVEATTEDVILILRPLWERAGDLSIDAETRISFHANVLLAAMGGFRPGCLGKTRYRDIVMSVVRDTQDFTKQKHVTTLTVKTNKIRESLSTSKVDKVTFSACIIPFPLACLTRLIIARAIHDDAFDAGYTNEQQVMQRPDLGNVNYAALQWKTKVLDQEVFKLFYERFRILWHKICQIAGFRSLPRLYALRVGTAARLDKDPLFSRALSNYVLKHTTAVFETSYQTNRLREDLANATFGNRIGAGSQPLFASLRDMSLARDSNAPFELGLDDWLDFDKRKDVSGLRETTSKARADGDPFHKTLKSRMVTLRRTWSALKLADNRRKYFEEAGRYRAQGGQPPRNKQHTTVHAQAIRSNKSRAQMAHQISLYYDRWWNSTKGESPERYIQLLTAYLKGTPKLKLEVWEEDMDDEDVSVDDLSDVDGNSNDEEEEIFESQSTQGNRHRTSEETNGSQVAEKDSYDCLLCRLKLKSRRSLTRHYDIHMNEGILEEPFQCPECRMKRKKSTPLVGEGYNSWLNHMERFHDAKHMPYFQQAVNLPEGYPCPFQDCASHMESKRFNSRGLTQHVRRGHAQDTVQCQFKKAIQCWHCAADTPAASFWSVWDWKQHFSTIHGVEQSKRFQCFICLAFVRTHRGLKCHFNKLHERREGFFDNHFTCPGMH